LGAGLTQDGEIARPALAVAPSKFNVLVFPSDLE
jgi:hypothetical protein